MSHQNAYATARFNMVEGQIRTNRVSDPDLLSALSETPRHIFAPGALASVAYVDTSLRIAPDRYLMEPLALGRLLQEAVVGLTDRAMVVGAGTGYSVAIVSRLAASVSAVESDPELAAIARANLSGLDARNVAIETGPMERGWSAGAPYDVILIDGMIADFPGAIAEQLAEGGRLVTLKAQEGRCGAGMLYRKLGGAISGRVLFDAAGPFLPGFAPQPVFAL